MWRATSASRFGPGLFLGPLGPFEASVRAEPDALSGGFVQRFD